MGPNEAAAWLAAAKSVLEKAVQQGIHVDGGLFGVFMTVAVGLGLANCFFGYRVLKILLTLWGLVMGAVGGAAVGWHLGGQTGALIGAMVGGLTAACSVAAFYLAGVFALSALIGAAGAAMVCDAYGYPVLPWMIGAALGFGLLGLILQKLVVVLATSAGGAALAVVGGFYFMGPVPHGDFRLFTDAGRNTALVAQFKTDVRGAEGELKRYAMENETVKAFADQRGRLWVYVAVLAALGAAVQFGVTGKRRKILQAAGDPVG